MGALHARHLAEDFIVVVPADAHVPILAMFSPSISLKIRSHQYCLCAHKFAIYIAD